MEGELLKIHRLIKYVSKIECRQCQELLTMDKLEWHLKECLEKNAVQYEALISGVNYLKNNGNKIEVFNIKVTDNL